MKKHFLTLALAAALSCSFSVAQARLVNVKLLATSDTHGKMYTWDYAQNQENTSGSMTQLASALQELRTPNTILLDAGDTIQDNTAQIFLKDQLHPMVLAMNEMGYDVWVTGNHEYNFGMDTTKSIMAQQKAKVLVGNVFDKEGHGIADPYTILERDGVKIGVIGMVTPNIARWDSDNLKDYEVKSPIPLIREAIDKLQGEVDVLAGVMHMDLDNEFEVPGSGVRDIVQQFPEFDVIIAAHGHKPMSGALINGVLVVENQFQAATMADINLTIDTEAVGRKVISKTSQLIKASAYENEPELTQKLQPYHQRAIADAEKILGRLEGGSLLPEEELPGISPALLQDTPLIDLINEVQHHYTGAKVSAAPLTSMNANLHEGDIHNADLSRIYKFSNTLYKLEMNGRQLKKYMEWSAKFYQQYQPGDLTIAFSPEFRSYNYDMFSGVKYQIDISQPVGQRIQNLTWPDGTEVGDDELFTFTTNNYRCNSYLLTYGEIFTPGEELPKCLEQDIRGDLGGIRDLIGDYIANVKKGVITPDTDNSWQIIGNTWDGKLHQQALELLAQGRLHITNSPDGRLFNTKPITERDYPFKLLNGI